MGPANNLPFSPISPDWPAINVISPSTASHHSVVSESEQDDDFRSPQLALLTSGLKDDPRELHQLVSPSAPIPQPGDELLYNVTNEEKPDVPFFNSDLQASLARTKQEMKDISLALWGCPASHLSGSDTYALKQRAQQLGEFEPMRTRRIALVGNNGAGKSGLINALLDQSRLAHPGYSSNRSAFVITEYWFRPAHCNEPLAIEVDYLTTEEIRELIQELLRIFRAGHDTSLRDTVSFEERHDIRLQAEKAWSTLHSMFRNQQFFTKEFLLRYPINAQTPLLDVLHHWATDFLATRPGGGKARTWYTTAFDAEECSDKLDAFVSDPVDEGKSALWPFIRLTRVYLRSPILQSGAILVDCPTPHDLDYARARSTERCLRNCHEIFAVTSRRIAINDPCVSDIVKRIGRHRPLSIVCTKTDDISIREVERGDPEVSLQVRTWRQQVETLRMQVKRNEAQRRHGSVSALQEEARTRDLLEEMEFGLKQFLVERRNGQVANQLIDKYAEHAKMGDLKIFCVSSSDYWEHRHDEHQKAIPRLDLSGIVDLRRYCHSVAAEVQFEEATAFLEHDVPAFLSSLKQWAIGDSERLTAEKAEEIRLVTKNLEAITIDKLIMPSTQLQTAKAALNAEFASAIVLPIREHRSEWRSAALEASKEWTKWSANDYIAFCRHHGNHTTEATGHRHWNEELIESMRLQLEKRWDLFQTLVKKNEKELVDYVDQVFDELCAPLQEHLPSSTASIQTLLASLPHRKSSIHHLIHIIFASLLEATQTLKTDALHGHLSSYINTLMAPAYHTASALLPSSTSLIPPKPITLTPPHSPSPSLIDHQRKDVITTHIASARIFSRLSSMVEKAHRGIVREAFYDLNEGIAREVDALVGDLRAVGGEAGKEGEEDRYVEFREGLRGRILGVEHVVREAGVVVGEVRRAYAEEEEEEAQREGRDQGA
ncbi:hypothetical protein K458DRAFT_311139 [Lentithecium fluviatile CBS 122367]|uniref:DUF7605 domain-containing protein n=1 Tax=Lentithecium fluviatile CBS 122367 TaxID=1168545 RepID=A0A6G1IS61_9PLEO|nr:hypothetical protein K458DRAFT_311139 [Lentithecium fluviatile CBS 122367]